MTSTFTARLNLEKPGTGDQDDSWGSTLNDNFDTIDEGVAGYLAKSIAGGAGSTTLTDDEAINPVIELTGTITGNRNVIVPTREGNWDFINSTTGAFTVTVKTSAGTGVQVPSGGAARVVGDGTDVVQILTTSTTALSNVVEDTSPSLGGALDTNDKPINFSEGSSVSSASSTNIWATDGNTVHITGTTTITSFATAPRVGAIRQVIFDGVLTLTDGSSIILPGGENITTAAGDIALVYAETTAISRVLVYTKASGLAVVTDTPSAASQAQQEAGSSTTTFVAPARQQFHDSAAKSWIKFNASSGSPVSAADYNVSSITDNSVGNFTINFTNAFSTAHYAGAGMTGVTSLSGEGACTVAFFQNETAGTPPTTSAARILVASSGSTLANPSVIDHPIICCEFFGDLA